MTGPQKKKNIADDKGCSDLIDQERLYRELDIKDDTIFLVMSCGRCDYALSVATHIGCQGRIFAFDMLETGIDRLIDEIIAGGITHIYPRVCDLCTLPLGNGTIDICLMATVFHDLVQQGTDQILLSEIKRVLKPGGVLAVLEFKKISGHPGPPLNIRISPAELDETLRLYGFTPVKNREIEVGACNYLSLYHISNGLP
ncbi:MAG: methyltransferase domain-containing protein [Proteobacteria bacterium]|nr:methyltransferase domain-containing protein [Pseudomonadota bacterium]MBU0966659.1 methyltransferase domain-containing protein [Pseudomonadota bacterium]